MTDKDNKLIERFFSFDLTETELKDFDARMETDEHFLEKMRLYQFIDEKVEAQFNKDSAAQKEILIQKWNKMQQEAAPTNRIIKMPWIKIMGMAASFLIIAGVAFWLIPQDDVMNSKELANQYWETTSLQHLAFQRTEEISSPHNPHRTILIEASETYKQGQFKKAKALANNIPESFIDYPMVLLLKGQCDFKLDEMDAAIQNFQAVIDHKSSGPKDLALWFQALSYLKMDTDEGRAIAKKNLNLIITERYPIANKAEALFQKIDHL